MASWLDKLNEGSIEKMWRFLCFHPEKIRDVDIDVLTQYLDDLRVMMVQKTSGQPAREPKTKGALDFEENLEMTINAIVIQTMWIYLAGGFDKLKKAVHDEQDIL